MQLGIIVSYVLGPMVILGSENKSSSSPESGCEADFPNWSYYLMGQTIASFVIFFITVTGKYVVPSCIH